MIRERIILSAQRKILCVPEPVVEGIFTIPTEQRPYYDVVDCSVIIEDLGIGAGFYKSKRYIKVMLGSLEEKFDTASSKDLKVLLMEERIGAQILNHLNRFQLNFTDWHSSVETAVIETIEELPLAIPLVAQTAPREMRRSLTQKEIDLMFDDGKIDIGLFLWENRIDVEEIAKRSDKQRDITDLELLGAYIDDRFNSDGTLKMKEDRSFKSYCYDKRVIEKAADTFKRRRMYHDGKEEKIVDLSLDAICEETSAANTAFPQTDDFADGLIEKIAEQQERSHYFEIYDTLSKKIKKFDLLSETYAAIYFWQNEKKRKEYGKNTKFLKDISKGFTVEECEAFSYTVTHLQEYIDMDTSITSLAKHKKIDKIKALKEKERLKRDKLLEYQKAVQARASESENERIEKEKKLKFNMECYIVKLYQEYLKSSHYSSDKKLLDAYGCLILQNLKKYWLHYEQRPFPAKPLVYIEGLKCQISKKHSGYQPKEEIEYLLAKDIYQFSRRFLKYNLPVDIEINELVSHLMEKGLSVEDVIELRVELEFYDALHKIWNSLETGKTPRNFTQWYERTYSKKSQKPLVSKKSALRI